MSKMRPSRRPVEATRARASRIMPGTICAALGGGERRPSQHDQQGNTRINTSHQGLQQDR
ncbi:hypothetical protein AB4Z10_24405 [Bosea sp. RAF48]|uniref:hypothetical protein n=1 Tax=Bosea sp. RAF48 TaxID=3237480 RepID=UPI003F906843